MTTYDLTTGRDVGRYETPAADQPDRPLPPRILGAGDQLLAVTSSRTGSTITAHEIPGLRPRWQQHGAATAAATASTSTASPPASAAR